MTRAADVLAGALLDRDGGRTAIVDEVCNVLRRARVNAQRAKCCQHNYGRCVFAGMAEQISLVGVMV